jgi:hypothetical protein
MVWPGLPHRPRAGDIGFATKICPPDLLFECRKASIT